MPDKTEKNLAYAFAAECKACARNATFAKEADMDGDLISFLPKESNR